MIVRKDWKPAELAVHELVGVSSQVRDDVWNYSWQQIVAWPQAAQCRLACLAVIAVLADDENPLHQKQAMRWVEQQVLEQRHQMLSATLLMEMGADSDRRKSLAYKLFVEMDPPFPVTSEMKHLLVVSDELMRFAGITFAQARSLAEVRGFTYVPPRNRVDLCSAIRRVIPPASEPVRLYRLGWMGSEPGVYRYLPRVGRYILRVTMGMSPSYRSQLVDWSEERLRKHPDQLAVAMTELSRPCPSFNESDIRLRSWQDEAAASQSSYLARCVVRLLREEPSLLQKTVLREQFLYWLRSSEAPMLWAHLKGIEEIVRGQLPDQQDLFRQFCRTWLETVNDRNYRSMDQSPWKTVPDISPATILATLTAETKIELLRTAWTEVPIEEMGGSFERTKVESKVAAPLVCRLLGTYDKTPYVEEMAEAIRSDLVGGRVPLSVVKQIVHHHLFSGSSFFEIKPVIEGWLRNFPVESVDLCDELLHECKEDDADAPVEGMMPTFVDLCLNHGVSPGRLIWAKHWPFVSDDDPFTVADHPLPGLLALLNAGYQLKEEDFSNGNKWGLWMPWWDFRGGVAKPPKEWQKWIVTYPQDAIKLLLGIAESQWEGTYPNCSIWSLCQALADVYGEGDPRTESVVCEYLLPAVRDNFWLQSAFVEHLEVVPPRVDRPLAKLLHRLLVTDDRWSDVLSPTFSSGFWEDVRQEGVWWPYEQELADVVLTPDEQRHFLLSQGKDGEYRLSRCRPGQVGHLWDTDEQRRRLIGWLLTHPLFPSERNTMAWFGWVRWSKAYLAPSAAPLLDSLVDDVRGSISQAALALLRQREQDANEADTA